MEVAAAHGGGGGGQAAGDGSGAAPQTGAPATHALSIPQQLEQRYCVVPAKLRLVALVAALAGWLSRGVTRLVVFTSSCECADFLAALLPRLLDGDQPLLPCPVAVLHGGMAQPERRASFAAFGKGGAGILVATDVAARGLDFPAVGAAVQLDAPRCERDRMSKQVSYC